MSDLVRREDVLDQFFDTSPCECLRCAWCRIVNLPSATDPRAEKAVRLAEALADLLAAGHLEAQKMSDEDLRGFLTIPGWESMDPRGLTPALLKARSALAAWRQAAREAIDESDARWRAEAEREAATTECQPACMSPRHEYEILKDGRCPDCWYEEPATTECPKGGRCKGSGVVATVDGDAMDCPECGDDEWEPATTECGTCGGKGYTHEMTPMMGYDAPDCPDCAKEADDG